MAIEELPVFDPQGRPHLTLVETPPGVPPPEIPIVTIGRNVRETWDHVWGWIRNSPKVIETMADVTADPLGQKIINFTSAFVGQQLHALASVVNDLSDYAYGSFENAAAAFDWTYAHIHALEFNTSVAIAGILSEINNLTDNVVPAIEAQIFGLAETIDGAIGAAVQNVEQWSVDNIFDPLTDTIGQVSNTLNAEMYGLGVALQDEIANTANGLRDEMNQLRADLGTDLLPIAAAVTALEKFKDECAEPMCETMGPSTDLGKFLKALQLAGILSLLMEIGNMTEADVEQRIRDLAGDVQGIVGAFDNTFVGGGGSLRDFALSLL